MIPGLGLAYETARKLEERFAGVANLATLEELEEMRRQVQVLATTTGTRVLTAADVVIRRFVESKLAPLD